ETDRVNEAVLGQTARDAHDVARDRIRLDSHPGYTAALIREVKCVAAQPAFRDWIIGPASIIQYLDLTEPEFAAQLRALLKRQPPRLGRLGELTGRVVDPSVQPADEMPRRHLVSTHEG